jgi:hypothetical protein
MTDIDFTTPIIIASGRGGQPKIYTIFAFGSIARMTLSGGPETLYASLKIPIEQAHTPMQATKHGFATS